MSNNFLRPRRINTPSDYGDIAAVVSLYGVSASSESSCDCRSCTCTCVVRTASATFKDFESHPSPSDVVAVNLVLDWEILAAASSSDCAENYPRLDIQVSLDGGPWSSITGWPKHVEEETQSGSVDVVISDSMRDVAVRVTSSSRCDRIDCEVVGNRCIGSSACESVLVVSDVHIRTLVEVGRCCSIGGSCTLTSESSCVGSWVSGLDCETSCPVPTGACCDSGLCTVTTESECSGVWLGADTNCSEFDCGDHPPVGSCCELGRCRTTTESNCAGVWTPGQDCSPNPCARPFSVIIV